MSIRSLSNSNIVGNTIAANTLIAVKDVLKTDTFSASVSGGGNVAVTDLSITHQVSNPANKLIITAFFGVAGNSNGLGDVGIAIHDGTSLINVGDSAGSRVPTSAGGQVSDGGAAYVNTMPSISFVYSPGAGSKTYTVRAININASTQTLYVNRRESDTDAGGTPRAVSSLVIQEVAV